MAPDIAAQRRRRRLVGHRVLEDLEVQTGPEPEEAQFSHDRVGRDAEVDRHPFVVRGERSEIVELLSPEDVDEEPRRRLEVRDSDPDVVATPQARKHHRATPPSTSVWSVLAATNMLA